MNLERAMKDFELISGKNAEEFLSLIKLSAAEVERRLKSGADKTDERLCGLCAALANLKCVEIECAREKLMLTPGGGVAVNSSQDRIPFAEEIVKKYTALCADLLADDGFVFLGAKGW